MFATVICNAGRATGCSIHPDRPTAVAWAKSEVELAMRDELDAEDCLLHEDMWEDKDDPDYRVTILELSEPKTDNSTLVTILTVLDPDTRLLVEVEIRKLKSGRMVGFDGSYLKQLVNGENPIHPYEPNAIVIVPGDEEPPGARRASQSPGG